jgi:hypothetical protein
MNDTAASTLVYVIDHDLNTVLPRKYGIQWTQTSSDDRSLSMLNTIEYEQGDSVSLTDATVNVKDKDDKFEYRQIHPCVEFGMSLNNDKYEINK